MNWQLSLLIITSVSTIWFFIVCVYQIVQIIIYFSRRDPSKSGSQQYSNAGDRFIIAFWSMIISIAIWVGIFNLNL